MLVLAILALEVLPAVTVAQEAQPPQVERDRTPEEALVERYAPVIYLKRQRQVCDTAGEPYVPLPIDAVLGDPQVLMRLDTGGDSAAHDLIVKPGPEMDDLAWLGYGYYLDFPGNPMSPGCLYEMWSRSKAEEYEPTVYARIATEDGEEGLAIQYWMFFVFNDFNNRHEGDWELVQLNFEASTVEGALNEDPFAVTISQHGGGERATWDGGKLRLEGSHPIIYPAAGSHALHYTDQLYIGWGEGGAGFGCDDTTSPSRRLEPAVLLMPDDPEMNGAFAWMLYKGRWGERQPWEFNGPRGPIAGRRWYRPVTWIDEVRDSSLYLPESLSIGPTPGSVFCTVTETASQGLMFFTVHPWRAAIVMIAAFGGIVYLLVSRREQFIRAAWLYLRYWGSFSSLGLIFIPIGIIVAILQQFVSTFPPGSWIVDLLGRSDEGRLAASLLIGSAQGFVEAVLIGPAVVAVIRMIRRDDPTDADLGIRHAREHIRPLVRSWLRVQGVILLKAISIIGIPFALRDMVRWAFYQQAIMIDGAQTPRGAASTSAAAVSGTWWRTAAGVLLFSVIGLIPGPLIGIFLMMTVSSTLEFVSALSSIVYAVAIPFKWIGLTLLYLDRTGRPLPIDVPNVPGAFIREVRERLPFGPRPNPKPETAS